VKAGGKNTGKITSLVYYSLDEKQHPVLIESKQILEPREVGYVSKSYPEYYRNPTLFVGFDDSVFFVSKSRELVAKNKNG